LKGLIGKKIGMTQVFDEDGNLVPVTVIDASTCTVVGKRTPERDRYSAVTLGFGKAKEKRLTAAQKGSFKKAGVEPRRVVKEFRVTPDEASGMNVGDTVGVQLFEKGQLVDVTGVTKGRGFQGVMKRWNFRGFGQTHGTHEYRRHGGSIGTNMTPGRTLPGLKMPGQYGNETVTAHNLKVARLMVEDDLVLIEGAVPGPKNQLVIVRGAIKKKNAGKKA
jgi:large subunit ribosomal protein L3